MHRTRLSGILIACAALVFVGCGSAVQFVPVDTTVYESRPKNHLIEVHTAAVQNPHIVLGTLTVEKKLDAGYGSYSTYDLMIDMLQQEARKVGGDGLVNVRPLDNKEHLDTTVILQAQVVRYLERQESFKAQ